MAEEWKDIEGYPGYRISNSGRVWSKTRNMELKVLRYEKYSKAYCYVNLYRKGCGRKPIHNNVHRLVATHFIPNPENKPTVNHKDKDKTNNCVSNLEWATYSEQEHHKNLTYKHPTKPIVLEKDGVEYPFNSTREAIAFLKTNSPYWRKLVSGESIKGFKIKNVAGV
jgi:hypothetical protein